jgi:hypothetical protein
MPSWEQILAERVEKPPKDLGSLASTFLATLYSDRQWTEVQSVLEQLARDNSIQGVLRRQEEALLGIVNRRSVEPPDWAEAIAVSKARREAQQSLAAELQAAEEHLRATAAQLAEQLAEVAEETQEDSEVAPAAEPIKRAIESTNLAQKLGPYWIVVLLFWLIYARSREIEAASLLYLVLNDYLKKD